MLHVGLWTMPSGMMQWKSIPYRNASTLVQSSLIIHTFPHSRNELWCTVNMKLIPTTWDTPWCWMEVFELWLQVWCIIGILVIRNIAHLGITSWGQQVTWTSCDFPGNITTNIKIILVTERSMTFKEWYNYDQLPKWNFLSMIQVTKSWVCINQFE